MIGHEGPLLVDSYTVQISENGIWKLVVGDGEIVHLLGTVCGDDHILDSGKSTCMAGSKCTCACSSECGKHTTEVGYRRSRKPPVIGVQHDYQELQMSSRIDPKAPRRALSYWGVVAPPLTAAGKSLSLSSRRPVSRSTAKAHKRKPKSPFRTYPQGSGTDPFLCSLELAN